LKKSASVGGKSQVNIFMDEKYERLLPAVFAQPPWKHLLESISWEA